MINLTTFCVIMAVVVVVDVWYFIDVKFCRVQKIKNRYNR